MNLIGSAWRTLKTLAATAVCFLAVQGTALAQPPKEEEGGGKWIMSYFLVLLGTVLGMLLVCRTSRRRERAKPQAYVKGKLMGRVDDEAD